jgi:hypothetical protein
VGPIVFFGALVLLAQASPAGATARYKVTLEFVGVWGLVTEANGTCPGVPPGRDTITGIVEGIEPAGSSPPTGTAQAPPPGYTPCFGVPCRPLPDDEAAGDSADEDSADEGVQYTGVLTRTTTVGLCEAKDTPSATEWCAGHLSGGGPFRVTITVPPIDGDNEQARVKLEPQGMAVWATVSGSCSSLENAAVATQYRSEDSIYFETVNALGTKLMPTGRLSRGTYVQTSRSAPGDLSGYTLTVVRVP